MPATKYDARGTDVPSGPHTAAELASLAADGTLSPDDRVRRVGSRRWHRAGEVDGLRFAEPTDSARLAAVVFEEEAVEEAAPPRTPPASPTDRPARIVGGQNDVKSNAVELALGTATTLIVFSAIALLVAGILLFVGIAQYDESGIAAYTPCAAFVFLWLGLVTAGHILRMAAVTALEVQSLRADLWSRVDISGGG
ncbi:GYF domain-containing protein [Alienimonas chondri]|nr:GYF domain-containing protein [Alienimonas chondri]